LILTNLQILKNKKAIGSYWFSALYQQEPVPAGHSIFKRLYFCYFQSFENYFELSISPTEKKQILKNQVSIMATMDLAISTKETADYTVALVFGKTQTGEILVIDVIRERFETNEHINLLNSIYAKYKPVIIGIENVQYQQSLIQSAIKEGLPIKSLRPDKDKISRALPIASLIENGKVYFRKGAIYLEEFENELLQFPKGKNDDQVDALSYIFQMLPINSGLLPV
jgi:predicted phage terminase large subunit-like protein